jgi:hypothetical protein
VWDSALHICCTRADSWPRVAKMRLGRIRHPWEGGLEKKRRVVWLACSLALAFSFLRACSSRFYLPAIWKNFDITQFILPGSVCSWEGAGRLEDRGCALFRGALPSTQSWTPPLLEGEETWVW